MPEGPPDVTKATGMCSHGNFPDSCEACNPALAIEEDRGRTEEEAWDPREVLKQLTGHWEDPDWDRERNFELRQIISALAEGHEFNSLGDQYANQWKRILDRHTEQDEARFQALRERVSGKTVVDLGGGYTFDSKGIAPSVMQGVVEKLGAQVYVNVDRFFPKHENQEVAWDISGDLGIQQPEKMKVIYTPGDILGFLAQMPSGSPDVVLVLNGIDGFVIPRSVPGWDHRSPYYFKMVADELLRVLPKGGVVLTSGSEDVTEHFEDTAFEAAPGYSSEKGAMFGEQLWVKK